MRKKIPIRGHGNLQMSDWSRFNISRAHAALLDQYFGAKQARHHLATYFLSFLKHVESKMTSQKKNTLGYSYRSVRKTYRIDDIKLRFETYLWDDCIYGITAVLPDYRGSMKSSIEEMRQHSETFLIEEALHGNK